MGFFCLINTCYNIFRGIFINKKIEIDKEHILLASVSPGYPCETFSVSEIYINNGEILKSLEFTIWDDMAFYVFCNNDKLDNIEFEFDINHPLYFSIKKLLGCDKQLIIDDDSTAADLKKYMVIKQEDEKYKFIFFNTKNKENYDYYNFGVFIKNILPDARSKISDFSIKLRLVDFFRNVQTNLLDEYHQITLDEYLEFINNKSKTLTLK